MSATFFNMSSFFSNRSESPDPSISLAKSELPTAAEEPEDCSRIGENSPMDYLDKEIFPTLLPCLEQMLFAAEEEEVLRVQKSRFSGLDHLAELLWNRNPLHPKRRQDHVPIFEIPFVQELLHTCPRPVYPKSWLWSREEAAVVIQGAVRGHLVRKQPEVQEMRQFWRDLAQEKLEEELAKSKYSTENVV